MGTISPNLSRREFLCRCGCGLNDPHPFLVVALQEYVDLANKTYAQRIRIHITGPGRCHVHNESVGGAPSSRHLPRDNGYYLAVDCHLDGGLALRQQLELATKIKWFRDGGIGVYCDAGGPRLHLDVRGLVPPYRAGRWARLEGHMAGTEETLEAADEWMKERQAAQTARRQV